MRTCLDCKRQVFGRQERCRLCAWERRKAQWKANDARRFGPVHSGESAAHVERLFARVQREQPKRKWTNA